MFEICTITNNLSQYAAMKASFLRAGFDEERCRYRVFDNSSANNHECYGTFNRVMEETQEPYLIFCHQDVLLDQSHGYEELLNIIEKLDQDDPAWAILGNAGATQDHQLVRRLRDPFGESLAEAAEPVKVCSLDENFLVVKTDSNIRCSAELAGFHLYATDLCLQALQRGRSCYVVSFHLTHLSKGQLNDSFYQARQRFQKQWSGQFKFRYVQTACTTIFLSKNEKVRFLFSSYRVTRWLLSNRALHTLVCRFSDQSYAA